jgi:2-haloacid dehalogenase
MSQTPSTMSRRALLGAGAATMMVAGAAAGGAAPGAAPQPTPATPGRFASLRALVFDTFGTVVDWRRSVARDAAALATQKRLSLDAEKFADAWRGGYGPSMNRVRTSELPWTKLDALHRMTLDSLLGPFGLTGLSEPELETFNRAWHRLEPWPDAVAGLTRLKRRFIIAPLSNGNISLMTNLAKHAGLPWDCILGAELARHYKPDREVYQSAFQFLDQPPKDVLMVAAHLYDLRAAKAEGLSTAFVPRPHEYGPAGKPDLQPDASVDVTATDFTDLARQLGA